MNLICKVSTNVKVVLPFINGKQKHSEEICMPEKIKTFERCVTAYAVERTVGCWWIVQSIVQSGYTVLFEFWLWGNKIGQCLAYYVVVRTLNENLY